MKIQTMSRLRWPWVSRAKVAERIKSYNRFNLFADPCHFMTSGAFSAWPYPAMDSREVVAAYSAVVAHQDALRCAMLDAGLDDPLPGRALPTYYRPLAAPP